MHPANAITNVFLLCICFVKVWSLIPEFPGLFLRKKSGYYDHFCTIPGHFGVLCDPINWMDLKKLHLCSNKIGW